ncbi:hypothetical protein [Bacillus infantis]|uniref:hypothetical protein n=1 Tax=Bacillus infantis TaxID=324767 RepID=UPI003CEF108B
MKKNHNSSRDLIYVHLNEQENYVMSYGIEFEEFARSLSDVMANLLLLKHGFDDGELNRHTLLEYVPYEKLNKLLSDDVYNYGDFCWIDFEELDGLNELPGQTIAELLYLGHLKEHLKAPFYNYLGNRFVYLAHDDGWYNKTYYRDMADFYRLLSQLIPEKLSEIKPEKSLLGLRKKGSFPPVPQEAISYMKDMMREGAVISIRQTDQNRARIEIPIWVIGDFANMDDMYEEYESIAKEKCEAKLVFDKKTREWKLYAR